MRLLEPVIDNLACFFFFSSRRRHTRFDCDWSSDVCSSDLDAWFLAAVPAGTPKPIVDRLYAEIAKALPAPEVKEKLDAMGVLPSGLKPDASAQFLRVEVDKWRDVIKNAGITLD